MDPLHYDEPWHHPHERRAMPSPPPDNPDPLTLMQAIIEAYKHWLANPTPEHRTDLDRIVRYADSYARIIEAKLHPDAVRLPEATECRFPIDHDKKGKE